MEAAAPHRGGTDGGRHLEERAALCQMQRFATGGASPAPHVHPETGVVVAADARLDNRDELERALGADAPSSSSGDAAVIAAVYLRWGPDGLGRLIGDFAFVLWDPRSRRLLLVRDPMAMRALFYRVEPDRVLVATEVKQILAVPGVPDDVDERMAASYLAGSFGDMAWSYCRGVSQVPPGHAVLVGPDSTRSWRFWDVDPGRVVSYRTQEEYAEHLRELLLEAVRARLTGNRPAGILLSGGMDSGAAASAAGWLIEREGCAPSLHSYSWDYGEFTRCDERHRSRLIVERYGIAGRDIQVDDAGPLSGFPAHAPDPDDPFHGHFQTMLDRGFAAARADGVGPLFTGMRGDLAAGPTDEDYLSLLGRHDWPGVAGELQTHGRVTGRHPVSLALQHILPDAARAVRRSSPRRWARWLAGGRATGASSGNGKPWWIDPGFARNVHLPDLLSAHQDPATPPMDSPFRTRRYQWLFMPMHMRWAVSHERRVASFGMEAVDPWSDRRIAEFCVALPQQVLDPDVELNKALVRQSMVDVVPDSFLRTAGKTVPRPIYDEGLRRAHKTVRNLLTESQLELRQWANAPALLENYEAFIAGAPLTEDFWWAISLEWWLRVRAEAPRSGTPPDGGP